MTYKILIVDDNPDLVFTVKTGLERINEDINVEGVNSGEECFEFLREDNDTPDLILLDIMMPEMNGWDLFAKIKENPSWKEIPVVFLTAKTDSYSTGFGKISAEDYIEKPFDIKDLDKRIKKILD
ncbi:MAG: response regulator [Candidatus Thermoplasmatota archaeon]